MSEACEERRWTMRTMLGLLRMQVMQIRRKDAFFDIMSRILLPYQFDAATMDPLRSVVEASIDFERLRSSNAISCFINATSISDNKNRIFTGAELSLDAVCASCCLPYLFDAVEIEGESYWDGGYMGNPTLYPLIYECNTSDIILIMTTPPGPRSNPESSAGILNRISQVSFTSAFMREMRAISFITGLIEKGHIADEAGLRKINIHVIAPPADDQDLQKEHPFNAEWPFMEKLRHQGRNAAASWLSSSFELVNQRSSFDLEGAFV